MNTYSHENFNDLLNQLEELEPTEPGALPDEYLRKVSEFDDVARVVHPGCPLAGGRDRLPVRSIRAYLDNLPSMSSGLEQQDGTYTADGFVPAGSAADTRDETAYAKRTNTKKYRTSFDNFIMSGSAGVNASEYRALQVDSDTSGGYIVAPEEMSKNIIRELDDQVFMRSLSTLYPVPSSVSLGVPSLDNDPSDSDWTAELLTGSEDGTMSFGKRELNPHPLAKRIKISNRLLNISTLKPGKLVQDRLVYKFAVTEEKAFLTGNGAQQPLGVFTASDDGVSTSRDVSTGNETTSITCDGLIEAFHGLKAQYQKNATWIFHPDAIKQIRKLKDGDGQYIFSPGIVNSLPASILGRPFFMSEFAPNTFTTGQYVGIVGDFSFYWIADALKMQIQRLLELYAETNQVGFIGRLETDGMPVLESAFSRVTLA